MRFDTILFKKSAVVMLAVTLFCSFGIFKKKKVVVPITKDTLQPDKVLFDRAANDISHGRYEVARLTLNTLINTYDSSEYLAKAKLAIADSWYREGGAHGLAQAEAEYKDFILFYPQMEEASESQWKVCEIHYQQMEKADRDSAQAQRAEDECRVLVTQFPNSHYVKQAQQLLRNVQEVIAQKEFLTGAFYHSKGSFPAAANRLRYVADQYPLFSGTDEALWEAADSYMKMGDRFENDAAEDYTRIARDYPLSKHAQAARDKLADMKRPVPEADPKMLAQEKYNLEHIKKPSEFSKMMEIVRRGPDTHMAAKEGDPAMATLRPPTPVSVPQLPGTSTGANGIVTGGTGGGTSSEVTVGVSTNGEALDKAPDARQSLGAPAPGAAAPNGEVTGKPGETPAAAGDKPATAAAQPAVAQGPLPTNHVAPKKTKKQLKQEEEFRKKQVAAMQKAAADAKKAEDEAAKKQQDQGKQPDPTKQPDSKQE